MLERKIRIVVVRLIVTIVLTFSYSTCGQVSPVIVGQPKGLIVSPGSTVSFTVVATGDAPLSYRWRRNGVTIPNPSPSGDTLVVSNATSPGVYTVIVSNSGGAQISKNVNLGFFSASNGIGGIELFLETARSQTDVYEIQYISELAAANWMTITNTTIPFGLFQFVDSGLTNGEARFYRAVQQ